MTRKLGRLINHLAHKDPKRRVETARELGALGDGEAVEPLINALANARGDDEIIAIARALQQVGDKRAIEPLLDRSSHGMALDDRNPARVAVAVAVTSFGDEAVPLLYDLLMASKRVDAIAELLAQIGTERAVAALISYLEYLDTEEGAASYSKSNMGLPAVGQQAVLRALGESPSPTVAGAMANVLATTSSMLTRELAAKLLISRGWEPSNSCEALRYSLALLRIEHSEHPEWNYSYPSDDPRGAPPLPDPAKAILEQWGSQLGGEVTNLVEDLCTNSEIIGEDDAKLLWALAGDLDQRAIDLLAELSRSPQARPSYYATCALSAVDDDRIVSILEEIAANPREVTLLDHDEAAFQHVGEQTLDNEPQRQVATAELQRRRTRR